MEYNYYLFFILLSILFISTQQQKLNLKTYTTTHYPVQTESWLDLLNVEVKCPNYGVLKNFVLRRKDGYYWYEYKCYSSENQKIDYGEPIIKVLANTDKYKYGINIKRSINTLNGLPVKCALDYGINSFKMTSDKNGVIQRDLLCYGLKSIYSSGFTHETIRKNGDTYTIDALVDVLVGSNEYENDEVIGFPLRGFEYIVDVSSSQAYPTVYLKYGYSKLRNMGTVRNNYKSRFESLRKSNTQNN